MDPRGTYSNTKLQVRQLESLLSELPDVTISQSVVTRTRKVHTARQLEPEQTAKLIAEYRGGATVYELATQFKIHRHTVSRILKDASVAPRYRRLSDEQIREAKLLYTSGWSLARIAAKFDVDPSTVHVRLRKLGVQMRDPQGRER